MPIIPIRNLGQSGILPDIPAYDLPTNELVAGQNARIKDGSIERSLGHKTIESLAGIVFATPRNAGLNVHLIVLTATHAWLYRSSDDRVDITPAAYIAAGEWTATQYGDFVVLTNGTDVWKFGAQSAALEAMALPAGMKLKRIASVAGHLFGIGYNDATKTYPFSIIWSDAVDPYDLSTGWDIADEQSLAGDMPLFDAGGELLAAGKLGNGLAVYSRNAVISVAPMGGGLVFGSRVSFSDDGLIHGRAWTEVNGRHFCIGERSIYLHDNNAKTPIADKRINRTLYSQLADPDSIRVMHHVNAAEVWIAYAKKGAVDPKKADTCLIWNYASDVWYQQELPGITDLVVVNRLQSGSTQWDGIQAATWADLDRTWEDMEPRPGERVPYLLTDAGILQADHGHQRDGATYETKLTQSHLDFDSIAGNAVSRKILRAIYPQITGQGKAWFRVGAAETPHSAPAWGDWIEFDIATQTKVSVRKGGKYIGIEFKKDDEHDCRLTGWDLDVEVRQGR